MFVRQGNNAPQKRQRVSECAQRKTIQRAELKLLREGWGDECPLRADPSALERVDKLVVSLPPYYGDSHCRDSAEIKSCQGMVFDWGRKQWYAKDRAALRRVLSASGAWMPEGFRGAERRWAVVQLQRLFDAKAAAAVSSASPRTQRLPDDTPDELRALEGAGFPLRNLPATCNDSAFGPRGGMSNAARALRWLQWTNAAIETYRSSPCTGAELAREQTLLDRVLFATVPSPAPGSAPHNTVKTEDAENRDGVSRDSHPHTQ